MSDLQTLLSDLAERQHSICQHIPNDLTERGRLFGFQEAARLTKAYAAEHAAQLAGFTVFLREADGTGTTHISYQEAADRNEAVRAALSECRHDWGREDDGSDEDDDLHVLGVAAGNVTVVEWDDLT